MFFRVSFFLKTFDWLFFSCIFLLISFGLMEIYSVALGQGSQVALLNFKKQLVFAGIGLILFFIFYFIDQRAIRQSAIPFFILIVFFLAAVLFAGLEIRGTRGWLDFGFWNFQPVEFAKVILIVFLAKFFTSPSWRSSNVKIFIFTLLSTLFLGSLVLFQPDFGSAVLLFATWAIMAFLADIPKYYFIIITVFVVAGLIFGWFFYFKDYQKERIQTFFNKNNNTLDQGYNVNQAVIAVGAGKWFGSGLGFGTQSRLKFLPESQNDFIFAVIAQEMGFFGVILLLSFFSVLASRILWMAYAIKSNFSRMIILGGESLIFIEMFINIGMNLGIVPVVGISLPFVSYGGSGLIAHCILAGIMAGAAKNV